MGVSVLTGGCQCGRVRFAVASDTREASLCHCRMCQRATGGVAAAFVAVPRRALTWTTRPPEQFSSSPIANRGYCASCGTPLTFSYAGSSDEIELTVGSFDDPYRFRPVRHFGWEGAHRDWLDTRDLPRQSSADNTNNRDRWMTALGKLPD